MLRVLPPNEAARAGGTTRSSRDRALRRAAIGSFSVFAEGDFGNIQVSSSITSEST